MLCCYVFHDMMQGCLVVDKLFPSDVCLVSGDGHTLLMKTVLGNHPTLVRALVNNSRCPINFKQMRVCHMQIRLLPHHDRHLVVFIAT